MTQSLEFKLESKSSGEVTEERHRFDALHAQVDLCNSKPVIPHSPCPYRFRYKYRIDDGPREGTWDGQVIATFRQPFNLLAETTAIAFHREAESRAISAKTEIWLPFLNTYRTFCVSPSAEMRKLFEGTA
jgi:hypothetical protein